MRTHVDRLRDAGLEGDRPDVVEEDERADHVPARVRQHAADLETAEVAPPLVDDIHGESFTRLATPLATNQEMGSDPPCPSKTGWQMGSDPISHSDLRNS